MILQQGIEHLVSYLYYIFRACLAYGCTPKAWGQVKVMFIAKHRKCDYNEAKTSWSISLLSFLLKKMQKLAYRHIKDILCIETNLHIKLESSTSQSGDTL